MLRLAPCFGAGEVGSFHCVQIMLVCGMELQRSMPSTMLG